MPSRQLTIRSMTEVDIATGLRLGGQNNWNQLEADWLRFLSMQPDGCFIAELDGVGVGTAATCIFDTVAWVALVLVDNAYRREGIGTALMEYVLSFLDERAIPCVRLDATPLGRPIYERLGFVPEYELIRYDGVLSANDLIDNSVTILSPSDLSEVIQLDQSVCATNRGKFLTRLYDEYPNRFRIVRRDENVIAYLASRPGANATQVGPCVGKADAALLLLADACRAFGGKRVYIDLPADNLDAVVLAQSRALQPQRRLLRMGRGVRSQEDVKRLFASSGPEKG